MIERHIRSFVLRTNRLTQAQQRALETLWQSVGVDLGPEPLNLTMLFGRSAPRVLEIGFGNGESLIQAALQHPETDYLGIEVYRPGIGHLLIRAQSLGLANIRVICADAVTVLEQQLSPGCIDHIQIFFPDPWPKKRHHKRRLIQPGFTALLARTLKSGGCVHLATDWEDYAQHMLITIESNPAFVNRAGAGCFAPRPSERPITKFERRGQRLHHQVWDLLFTRV